MVRSCQSTLVRAMLIRAGIVRDHVRDHVKDALVRAILVRATLVRATFIRAGTVRNDVRAHSHSREYYGVCQSHIDQTTIVRDHIWAACLTVEPWCIASSCYSTNLMRKILIVSGRSHTADTHVKPSHHWYLKIASCWWACVECLLLTLPVCFSIQTMNFDSVIELTFKIAPPEWWELWWEL
jgi:hypothetical protein